MPCVALLVSDKLRVVNFPQAGEIDQAPDCQVIPAGYSDSGPSGAPSNEMGVPDGGVVFGVVVEATYIE